MTASKITLSDKIFDEIALEGLEGITLSSLWLYLADSMKLTSGLPDSLKVEIWQFIMRNASKLQFFELPTERQTFPLYKRFEVIDEDFGIPLAMNINSHRRYKLVPIQDKSILGSCECYKERREITLEEIKKMNLDDIYKSYGERFVIVASQDLRYDALFPSSVLIPKDIPIQLYCTLETIGRSRFNGETTSGSVSLQNFCKDATLVFYIKNKLTQMGVIATQNYNELRNGRISQTTLVTLPRFYMAYQSALNFVIETVFNALQATPSHSLPFFEIRTLFSVVKKSASLKKIMDTHEFRRIFNVTTVKNSSKSDNPNPPSEESKELNVIVVSLRDSKMSPTDLFMERNNSDKLEEHEGDNASINKLAYVDMLVKDQVYNAIFRDGIRGLSQTEISCYLGIPSLTARQIIKKFLDERLISVYQRDAGRQRIQMYVASEFAANISSYKASMEEIKKLKCDDEPKLPPPVQQKFSEIAEVTSTVEPFKYIVKMTRDLSNRQIARMAIIINALNEKCLIHVYEVLSSLTAKEKELGYSDTACRKSLRRVLNYLVDGGKINIYEVVLKLKKESNVRVHRFITHPKIHINHEVVKNEILSLKSAFYFKIEEQRLQQESQRQAAVSKLKKKEKETKEAQQKSLDSQTEQKREVFQKIPKFLVSRYVHEFLFYIVVELNEYQMPQEITEDLVQHWKKTDPSLPTKEYMDLLKKDDRGVKAYTSELSWRTFIPPLGKYADKPAGWVYLLDAIDRMPLSIFMKIFSLENNLETNLEEYVSHPIRQHYLVNQLPVELSTLINRVYMQKIFLIVLKLMSHMGLVQVSDVINRKDKLMMWIFLNRNAVIVDTTPSEASYSKINPNRTYESIRYTFNTFDVVYSYWMNLQRICIYTKLGFRKNTPRNKQRVKELGFIEYVGFDEAPFKDIGYIPGDGSGAGGLSTELFAHVFRYWSWVVPLHSKLKTGSSYTTRRLPMSLESKNKVLRLKKAARKKQNFPVTLVKRLIPSHSGARFTQSNASTATKRNRANFRDAIDREALKNMRTLRVTWSAEEDKMLKIARAVYVFLTPPVISLPLVSVAKICRDVIRHTIGIRNKTIQACLRRFHFLFKNNRHLPETPLWINMLQTNEQLAEKYSDDFILQLKNAYPERNEFCNALAVHFIEVMCFLFKHINNIEEAHGPNFCIPDNISEFEQYYQVRLHTKNDEKTVLYENPKTDYDLKVSVVYGLLHSSMCCVRDKTLFTLQAFEIFKHFSEEVLKTAYTKARNDGLAVVLKRKYMNSQLAASHVAGPSYLLSSKYRFKLTSLKIPYQIYKAIYNAFQNILEAIYGTIESSALSQYYELKAPHIGQLLAICEGVAQNYWHTSVQFPVNILTVDSEQPICSTDRILHHYHGILDNAPKIEYIKNFSSENVEKQVRVKFHSANLSYKIYYAPYDLISKLSIRHLHFFCALDHLQQSVEINFSKLQRHEDDTVLECPFNCIMKNANYLDSISRIVHENSGNLTELQNTSTQKLFNQFASGNSIKIQPTNLLTIVRMLEKAWREKEDSVDRKDFGKRLMEMRDKKGIDWLKICQDILDFNAEDDDIDKSDEYEPMLTKDDRMRDAFVLNLPTIKLVPSDLLHSDKKLQYNYWKIPELLAPVETLREEILEKVKSDSLWVYTEENLKTLMPKIELKFDEVEQKHLEAVHDYIATKKFGVSFKELLCEFPYMSFLSRVLEFLVEHFLIKRVGVAMHIYVHKTHLREWVVHTFHITRVNQENLKAKKRMLDQDGPSSSCKRSKRDNEHLEKQIEKDEQNVAREIEKDTSELLTERDTIVLRPRPWIRLNGSLNRRVLDRWLGSLLTECLARNGCYVPDLCAHFQNMFPADIHFLLEILCDMKCLILKEFKDEEIDIFSEYKGIEEISIKEIIDPAYTYVTVLPDASSRMTNFIGNKKYNIEFI